MKIVSRDWVAVQKEARRATLPLEYHAHGDCIHFGKISPGCKVCFVRKPDTQFAIYTGTECNANCGYCYYDAKRTDESWGSMKKSVNNLADLYARVMDPRTEMSTATYNSTGETLKYPAVIKEASDLLLKYERDRGTKVYTHLYTNGWYADLEMLTFLRECRVTELRFHISAMNFSDRVYKNMRIAKELGFIVTVEEPSLPENKEGIMKALPLLQEIGITHLDIVECQVTEHNQDYLEKTYPEGRVYRDLLWHMYDEGMVYDIIEEVVKSKYTFSVIDCNSRVEATRDSRQMINPKLYDLKMMQGAVLV